MAASGRRPSEGSVAVGVVDHDQVEVGGRGHLAAAELAERDHGGAGAGRGAVAGGELGRDDRPEGGEHGVGDGRIGGGGFFGSARPRSRCTPMRKCRSFIQTRAAFSARLVVGELARGAAARSAPSSEAPRSGR